MESASPRGTGLVREGGRSFRLERARVVAIATPRPIETKPGTVIECRLRLHGVPVKWRTRGAWARRVFVARSLDRVFDSRRQAVAEIFDR